MTKLILISCLFLVLGSIGAQGATDCICANSPPPLADCFNRNNIFWAVFYDAKSSNGITKAQEYLKTWNTKGKGKIGKSVTNFPGIRDTKSCDLLADGYRAIVLPEVDESVKVKSPPKGQNTH